MKAKKVLIFLCSFERGAVRPCDHWLDWPLLISCPFINENYLPADFIIFIAQTRWKMLGTFELTQEVKEKYNRSIFKAEGENFPFSIKSGRIQKVNNLIHPTAFDCMQL